MKAILKGGDEHDALPVELVVRVAYRVWWDEENQCVHTTEKLILPTRSKLRLVQNEQENRCQ